MPVLDGAVGWLACDLRDLHDGGDHVIGVGTVTACDDDPSREPLVFHDGAYRTLDPGAPRPSRQPAAPGTR